MSRYALPLILNTVNFSTASAAGNTTLTSIRLFHSAFLAIRYQTSKGPPRSACSSAASSNFLRLMTCTPSLSTIRFAKCEDVKADWASGEREGAVIHSGGSGQGRGWKLSRRDKSQKI